MRSERRDNHAEWWRIDALNHVIDIAVRLSPKAQFSKHPATGLLYALGLGCSGCALLMWVVGSPVWVYLATIAVLGLLNTVLGTMFEMFYTRVAGNQEEEFEPFSDLTGSATARQNHKRSDKSRRANKSAGSEAIY